MSDACLKSTLPQATPKFFANPTLARFVLRNCGNQIRPRKLEKKFTTVPSLYREQISQMDTGALLELAEQILSSQSLEDLFKH